MSLCASIYHCLIITTLACGQKEKDKTSVKALVSDVICWLPGIYSYGDSGGFDIIKEIKVGCEDGSTC
jgi:hypothetical protein